ncbi:hypothetical protein IV487_13110 [Enterococcus saccharolyticus]|uniref:hypothetical protein n=1 Tax=Enterococcus saccharolyticus TaxID=41997 RepID=UPI001E3BB2D8|nr:hypothetical protein [Enterococcus saccharolyticus]MCD5003402.1 hypothetical protein [Enterococcus saccharolyticus]
MTYNNIRRGLLIFGFATLLFNISEFFWSKASPLAILVSIVECLLGIGLIYGPEFFKRYFKIVFTHQLVYFYWLFLFMSVFLGTCLHMMDIVPFWDKILHLTSPMILTAVGYGILGTLLEGIDTEIRHISPWVFLLFGFAFAGVCGVFWEFWEWSWDAVGNMNLQRYMTIDGVGFVGHAALADTMGDLLINTIGAILMGAYSWKQQLKNPDYFEGFLIKILK